jgi:hypothetical protein
MLDSLSPKLDNVAGTKRLLPVSEPSSSPPLKRQKSCPDITTTTEDENRHPTPVPSSSIGILPSPPPVSQQPAAPIPTALLSAVPSFILPANGQEIRFGRSSTCSHYKLSSNRLISRVHVKAAYHAAKGTAKANIQLKIVGWNGVKVHCQGREYELQKDDICMSEMEDVEIMLDVHGSRVVLEWPHKVDAAEASIDMVSKDDDTKDSDQKSHKVRFTVGIYVCISRANYRCFSNTTGRNQRKSRTRCS